MNEQLEDGDGVDPIPVVLPVVNVNKRSKRVNYQDYDNNDAFEDDGYEDLTDEELSENEEDDEGRHSPNSRHKLKNGKKGVDMTQPDVLLAKAQRKSEKYFKEKSVENAIRELIRITALARIEYGSSHWKYAQSYANLAEAYMFLKGLAPQAEYHCETAKEILLTSVHTPGSMEEKASVYAVLLKTYYVLGRACSALKKFKDAEQALNTADKMCRERSKLKGVSSQETEDMEIKIALSQAKLSAKQKKFAVASTQFDHVIDIMSQIFGDDCLDLISVYQEYGRLEQSKGKHASNEKVIDLFIQAHSIAAAHYKEGSEILVDTALGVARAYINTGAEETEASAEKYLNDCLATCTVVHGPSHHKTLEVQDELARLLIRMSRQEEALSILRSSINPKSEMAGEYSDTVSNTYKLIASVHLSQGSLEKALKSYKKCLNIETFVYGVNHKKTKDTQSTIDILMSNPALSSKFSLSKDEELKKRPKFNNVVKGK